MNKYVKRFFFTCMVMLEKENTQTEGDRNVG